MATRSPRARTRRVFVAAVALATVAAALLDGASGVAAAAAPKCPPAKHSIIRTAPGSGKTVALTFDDGPGNVTMEVLALLRTYKVRATFFNTGAHDKRYPAQTTQIAAEGHLVADHTWDHQYPSAVRGGWSRSYLNRQFDRTNDQQRRLTGKATCFFRPPGGFVTSGMTAEAAKNRMSTVMWSVDTNDWKQAEHTTKRSTRAIIRAAQQGYRQNHPIVLMHVGKASHEPASKVTANRSNDVAALRAIIKGYRSRGYRFVDMNGRSGLPARTTATKLGGVDREVLVGTKVTVTATVHDLLGPVSGKSVTWYSRPHGSSAWTPRGTVTLNRFGHAHAVDRPTAATDYTMRFPGVAGYQASAAAGYLRVTVVAPPPDHAR